jgi:hypothetical protein
VGPTCQHLLPPLILHKRATLHLAYRFERRPPATVTSLRRTSSHRWTTTTTTRRPPDAGQREPRCAAAATGHGLRRGQGRRPPRGGQAWRPPPRAGRAGVGRGAALPIYLVGGAAAGSREDGKGARCRPQDGRRGKLDPRGGASRPRSQRRRPQPGGSGAEQQ